MVAFHHEEAAPVLSLPVLRVKAGASGHGFLLSDSPMFVGTHWRDRLVLCPGAECGCCVDQIPRVMCYSGLAIKQKDSRFKPYMLELTTIGWSRLEGLSRFENWKCERGWEVQFSRKYTKSPLVCEPTGMKAVCDLPAFDATRLVQAFAVLFQLPQLREGESIADWDERVKSVVVARSR